MPVAGSSENEDNGIAIRAAPERPNGIHLQVHPLAGRRPLVPELVDLFSIFITKIVRAARGRQAFEREADPRHKQTEQARTKTTMI